MRYKNYSAEIECDDEAGVFHGRVVNIRDTITFEGSTVEELRKEFRKSVDVYLELCAKHGRTPNRPYSGKLVVRIDTNLHCDAAAAAKAAGESLNAFIARSLQRTLRGRGMAR